MTLGIEREMVIVQYFNAFPSHYAEFFTKYDSYFDVVFLNNHIQRGAFEYM